LRELPYGAITRWSRLVRFVLERSARVSEWSRTTLSATARREAHELVIPALLSIHNRYYMYRRS
jgi:hypothetical protein